MSTFPKPVACVYGHIYEILRAYNNTKERKLQNKWRKKNSQYIINAIITCITINAFLEKTNLCLLKPLIMHAYILKDSFFKV